jgi:GDPmannose 4,6-dehydratase
MKRALITGITGMDGSHMADLLLGKGYEVFGLERRRSSDRDYTNVRYIKDRITWIKGDLADTASLINAIGISQPDEVYNFAAQSFVGDSWALAEYTGNVTGLGVLRLLEAIKTVKANTKMVQASSSEMFGIQVTDFADEFSPFDPQSPYGIAKLFAHHSVGNYRKAYDMFVCCSVCFNHESERRGHQFVTRKITDGVAKIALEKTDKLVLGNLEPRRDWGYAPEYMEGIWKMLQQPEPHDFVFATGESHSVEDFVKEAFNFIGVDNWEDYVEQDPRFMRPTEVNFLRGNASKAEARLGWQPVTGFSSLVGIMLANDMILLGKENHESS